jgi:hypothetical protein
MPSPRSVLLKAAEHLPDFLTDGAESPPLLSRIGSLLCCPLELPDDRGQEPIHRSLNSRTRIWTVDTLSHLGRP